jgi:alkylation response protein AidB-like acyl-CoA dehydrogenase
MSTIKATHIQPCRISQEPMLSDSMMARFAARAPGYDRDNQFFSEDFEELRQAGYLVQAVPKELGGGGSSLAEVVRQQRRLGYHAAPTALAINMHLYWTGIAADLWRAGDQSLRWLLEEAAQGAIFAAGHAEAGNDIPVLLSTTRAERVDGGYRFTGRKCSAASRRCGRSWASMGWTRAALLQRSCMHSCRGARRVFALKRIGM